MASSSKDNNPQCFTSMSHTTRMEILQLKKLSELSDSLDGKMHLIKTFLSKTRDILKPETSQYAKEKLLEIFAIICHVDEAIKVIGKDVGLVTLIFSFLSRCNNNLRLQKTVFNLLFLVTCEIQSNSASQWIYHLAHSYKSFLGPNILRILIQNTDGNLLRYKVRNTCISIMNEYD